jgi:class 3 adenylate cyclase
MIFDDSTGRWLRHRIGEERLTRRLSPALVTKGIELNVDGPAFIDTFGEKEFQAFVGFVDLIGFSSRTVGRNPVATADYLKPFMGAAISSLVSGGCLVDKTLGDEIMFVLAEGDLHVNLRIGQAMGKLKALSDEYRATHPFRLGLAFGTLSLQRIGGDGYGEWTCVGEPVNLAKRLHGLPPLQRAERFAGAFGTLHSEPSATSTFEARLGHVTLVGMRWRVTEKARRVTDLKGLSPARVAVFE